MLYLHSYKINSVLNTKIKNFFSYFKPQIIELSKKQWNEEDLKGKGTTQFIIQDIYYLLYLFILIDIDTSITGKFYNWEYYKTKYNIEKLEDCINCKGINFKKAVEIFDFFKNCNEGIECIEVENTFIVEPEEIPYINFSTITPSSSLFMNNLLDNSEVCETSIISNCN
jgi:hypothetical protein